MSKLKVDELSASTGTAITVNDYVKIGSTAPAIKMLTITGTTNASAGGSSITYAHGLTSSKIISSSAIVFVDENRHVSQNFPTYEISLDIDSTNLTAINAATYAAGAKTFIATIFYKE